MTTSSRILVTARAHFPRSANKTVTVLSAWRPGDSGLLRPGPEAWTEQWTPVREPATYEVIARLRREGFTYVNLECGGCAHPLKDVAIAGLL